MSRVAGIAAALAFLLPASSWAQLFVQPVNINNTFLYNLNGTVGTAFYPSNIGASSYLDTGDVNSLTSGSIDLSQTQASDTSGNNALWFQVSSNATSFSGYTQGVDRLLVMAFVNGTTAPTSAGAQTDLRPIPIAYAGVGVPCNVPSGAPTNCDMETGLSLGPTAGNYYWYAVPYPYAPGTGPVVTIGIYPKDICIAQQTDTVTGCTSGAGTFPIPSVNNASNAGGASPNQPGGSLAAVVSQATTSINITFKIVIASGASYGNMFSNGLNENIFGVNSQPTNSSQSGFSFGDSEQLGVEFQSVGGQINTCPSMLNLYQPGQGGIFLNTSAFSFLSDPEGASSESYNYLDIVAASQVVPGPYVAGTNPGTALPITDPSNSSFKIFDRVAIGGLGTVNQLINNGSGDLFTNSTASESTFYNLAFFLRDYAGFLSVNPNNYQTLSPAVAITPPTCQLINVRTTAINGFLNESKCFIATGAFRSGRVPPVMMLRRFRDRILLNFGLGRGFVHWYYHWSPPAAEWLLDHPAFRYPVLLALVPVEAVALICLKPWILLVLLGASAIVFGIVKKRLSCELAHRSIARTAMRHNTAKGEKV